MALPSSEPTKMSLSNRQKIIIVLMLILLLSIWFLISVLKPKNQNQTQNLTETQFTVVDETQLQIASAPTQASASIVIPGGPIGPNLAATPGMNVLPKINILPVEDRSAPSITPLSSTQATPVTHASKAANEKANTASSLSLQQALNILQQENMQMPDAENQTNFDIKIPAIQASPKNTVKNESPSVLASKSKSESYLVLVDSPLDPEQDPTSKSLKLLGIQDQTVTTVQLGPFDERVKAQNLLERLNKMGFKTQLLRVEPVSAQIQ